MKTHAATALAVLFLLGLWVYQLPESPVERALRPVFRPVQKVMHTDRVYRMYAPDPRPAKRLPFLQVRTDLSPVRFFKPPLSLFALEKWNNFLDHLAKSLETGRFFFSEEEGRAMFRRLAERICREESKTGDRVRTVSLGARKVFYGEFRGDIVWDPPEVLESFSCQ